MKYGVYNTLTKENIYKRISGLSIFKKYCKNFEQVGRAFKSPIRDNDNKPSAFVLYYKGGYILKDFGYRSYQPIQFVMDYFHLSYDDAIAKINHDFSLGLGDNDYIPSDYAYVEHMDDVREKDVTIIKIKRREYDDNDHNYWYGNYGITKDTLSKFSVFPISHFSINDHLYFADKLAYSYDYYWEEEVFRRKIYQPMLSTRKWYSNGGLIVQGEGMLPKGGDLLIITSSLKDVMTLYELGYTAIAPTSETTFVPEKYFLKHKSRWNKILIFMDSDETGMDANRRLSDKWGLDYITIPDEYTTIGIKDISDLVKNVGRDMALSVLNKEIHKNNEVKSVEK